MFYLVLPIYITEIYKGLWRRTAGARVTVTRQPPKTPYTVAQLAQEYITIKKLLKKRSNSPPSPTRQALERVVKGCQMAMHNAALLASEIKDLRAMSARQKRKRKIPRLYIASGGVLTAEEGQNRVKRARIADKAISSEVITQPSGRRLPRCSIYSSLEYNVRVYPTRIH